MSNRALITGCTGQDGSYLAELLLSKGYEVFGLKRRTSDGGHRLSPIGRHIHIIDGDLCDFSSIEKAIKTARPDEVYNLAAQSFVATSFVQPEITSNITGLGTARMLEATRLHAPKARFYQASSSEMFGSAPPPQNEGTRFHPRSPYGCAKVYAYWMTINYRESYDMFSCNGILYNHESPRRGVEFVTQKIARGVARIKQGLATKLALGNLEAKRDWGHARDFVEAMWMILQQEKPDDFVVATGEAHTVREFADLAFKVVGLDYEDFVVVDPRFMRPAEVDYLLGDPTKVRGATGWRPKIGFQQLVTEMVEAAMRSDLSVQPGEDSK